MAKKPHIGQKVIVRHQHTGKTEPLLVQEVFPEGNWSQFRAGYTMNSANSVYVRPDDWIPAELDPTTPVPPVGPFERHMTQRAAEGLAQKTHDALERVFGVDVAPDGPKKEKTTPDAPKTPERADQDAMQKAVRALEGISKDIGAMGGLQNLLDDKRDSPIYVYGERMQLRYFPKNEQWALEWGPYAGHVHAQHTSYRRAEEMVENLRAIIAGDIAPPPFQGELYRGSLQDLAREIQRRNTRDRKAFTWDTGHVMLTVSFDFPSRNWDILNTATNKRSSIGYNNINRFSTSRLVACIGRVV